MVMVLLAGAVVTGVVADLLHRDAGRAFGQTQRRVRQGVAGVAGVDAVDVERRVAVGAGPLQGFAQPVAGLLGCHHPHERRADDVGTRPQEAADLGDRLLRPGLGL